MIKHTSSVDNVVWLRSVCLFNMKVFVVIFLFTIHSSLSTIDLDIITAKAARKAHLIHDNIETLKTNAHENLATLKENARQIKQTIAEKAKEGVKAFIDSIDVEKAKMYDYLHIIPKIEYKKKFLESHPIQNLPVVLQMQKEKLRSAYEQLQEVKLKDLKYAFDLD